MKRVVGCSMFVDCSKQVLSTIVLCPTLRGFYFLSILKPGDGGLRHSLWFTHSLGFIILLNLIVIIAGKQRGV